MAEFPEKWGDLRPIHIERAREFLSAAEKLRRAEDREAEEGCPAGKGGPLVRFDSAPLLFLYAHAMELALKALSQWISTPPDRLRTHDLVQLFNRAKSSDKSKEIISNAEARATREWRLLLRNARAEYITTIEAEIRDDVPDNEDIAACLPNLEDAVRWLDARHRENGGTFRYVQFGLDQIPMIAEFGLHLNIVPQTALWACDQILTDLETKLRSALKERRASSITPRQAR